MGVAKSRSSNPAQLFQERSRTARQKIPEPVSLGGPALSVDENAVFDVGKGGEVVRNGRYAGLAAAVSCMQSTRGGQTDSRVQDSEEAGRDGSVVGGEPMDLAQVAPASGSVPEVAVANSTTRTSTQFA